jgi:catechol 2,3-dioxygenase-like lactoylglutathione lyase family enzyme
MNVTGTDFVLIPCRDLATTERFYTDTLGLELGPRWGEMGFEIETGDTTLAFMEPERMGREFSPSPTAIVLHVDDVAASKAELEGKGVKFETDIIDSGVCHQAYFTDPDGNGLGIHHRYAPRD